MLKKLFIIIILIFIITGCSLEQASLIVNIDGNEEIIDVETIYSHEEAVTFPAVVRSSGEKPVETSYKGIELTKLFETLDIDISNYKKVTFNAYDGYRVILSIEEIIEPSNAYLTFERDNELLKTKKLGGNGPFQLIIRRDPFSQRWIKHVNEIILQ
ncbi:hypothetical protein [Sedimentibacter sp. MB31-C6]|uniref:hypothetical protein n=1 Tax=Sedimentibacter sp. MB31-C6 TaxID=3109366 RepID=UPI002DDC9050|nr:hypothetical protein [Sedimentibacter sp. MB36-C1]WSI02924.1 hypothetical protein U8307_07655 [Sedimentibacter sp. MB36-C1]